MLPSIRLLNRDLIGTYSLVIIARVDERDPTYERITPAWLERSDEVRVTTAASVFGVPARNCGSRGFFLRLLRYVTFQECPRPGRAVEEAR